MISNLPASWDLEADVVAIGSGHGLAAAITAHDHGASAMVLERSDQVGGVMSFSMGEMWIPGNHLEKERGIEDSIESGYRNVKQLSMGYADDRAIANQCIHGPVMLKYFEEKIGLKVTVIPNCYDYYYPLSNDSVAEGRTIEVVPFPAASLGEWQSRTRVSPHVPYGLTNDDMFSGGGLANILNWDYALMAKRLENDERCMGPGLAAYFVKGVLDRDIPIHTGVDVQQLIGDGERVVGVRAVKDGRDIFVKANRGVVLAVSSYERNLELSKTLGNMLDPESMVFPSVDGAHLRLAGQVGARIARVPDVTMLALHTPGEEQEEGVPLWRGVLPYMGLPHTIIVNRKGQRFADESFHRAIYYAVDAIDGKAMTHPNFPCWIIVDAQAREKYMLGGVMAGQELPEGMAVTADSIEELARRLGIDPEGLVATVARFNGYCETGKDPEFNRGSSPHGQQMSGDMSQKPNPNMGPLLKPPFYGIELRRMAGGGITSTGIMADVHCRAMGWNGQPIEGLYVAGNSLARLDNGAVMQSGLTNARGLTHGYIAGRHAAGNPSDLFDKERARFGL